MKSGDKIKFLVATSDKVTTDKIYTVVEYEESSMLLMLKELDSFIYVPKSAVIIVTSRKGEPVKEVEVGIKVVRGPHWCYGSQDAGSEYGILEREDTPDWWHVRWYTKDGRETYFNSYRISEDIQDLAYYE